MQISAQVQYADVLLDSYYSGTVPQFSDFYGVGMDGNLALINPDICLGNNPWFVSIPKDSYITVGFTDNTIFDAPNQNDIFIQEKGQGSELGEVYISDDMGATFTYFGVIDGGTVNAIDLADINYTSIVNAIKIVGLDNNGSAPGFDLVRIYGIEGANCMANATIVIPSLCQDSLLDLASYSSGTWSGMGWDGDLFNTQDTGMYQLTHIVTDSIPVCPNDTATVSIHISPCDCEGVPYGQKELDICHTCLDPQDSQFGLSCLDCAGVPFGKSQLDLCRKCILAESADACTMDNIFYVPNAFSPNGDGINDVFSLNARNGINGTIIHFNIFDRWGSLVYTQKGFPIRSSTHWWNGQVQNRIAPEGVYVYQIKIDLEGEEIILIGEITVVR